MIFSFSEFSCCANDTLCTSRVALQADCIVPNAPANQGEHSAKLFQCWIQRHQQQTAERSAWCEKPICTKQLREQNMVYLYALLQKTQYDIECKMKLWQLWQLWELWELWQLWELWELWQLWQLWQHGPVAKGRHLHTKEHEM